MINNQLYCQFCRKKKPFKNRLNLLQYHVESAQHLQRSNLTEPIAEDLETIPRSESQNREDVADAECMLTLVLNAAGVSFYKMGIVSNALKQVKNPGV